MAAALAISLSGAVTPSSCDDADALPRRIHRYTEILSRTDPQQHVPARRARQHAGSSFFTSLTRVLIP